MASQKPLATVIAIETIGSHRILLLSDSHVQIITDLTSSPRGVNVSRIHLGPEDAAKLYDFLLQYMSFIERRKQQNTGN